jgi:hypothetical protein
LGGLLKCTHVMLVPFPSLLLELRRGEKVCQMYKHVMEPLLSMFSVCPFHFPQSIQWGNINCWLNPPGLSHTNNKDRNFFCILFSVNSHWIYKFSSSGFKPTNKKDRKFCCILGSMLSTTEFCCDLRDPIVLLINNCKLWDNIFLSYKFTSLNVNNTGPCFVLIPTEFTNFVPIKILPKKIAETLPARSTENSEKKILLFYRKNFFVWNFLCLQKTGFFAVFAEGRIKPRCAAFDAGLVGCVSLHCQKKSSYLSEFFACPFVLYLSFGLYCFLKQIKATYFVLVIILGIC